MIGIKLLLFIGTMMPLNYAWPDGAPPEACTDFVPQHGVELKDHETAEFFLHFKAGKRPGVTLAKLTNGILPLKIRAADGFKDEMFKGFLVQGRYASNDEPAGNFVLINKDDEPFRMQHLACSESAQEATVTHADGDEKDTMPLFWKPPANAGPGDEFYFHYTVVKEYSTIWAARDSEKFTVRI